MYGHVWPTSICTQRSEYDGDLQSQLLSKANEEDKNCSRALSVVSAVVRAAKDLLHRAFAVDGQCHHATMHNENMVNHLKNVHFLFYS